MDQLSGSWNVEFTQVTSTPLGTYSPGTYTASHDARLDLRRGRTGYEATFAGRFGETSSYAVKVESDRVVLTGEGSIFDSLDCHGASETWKKIVLGLGPNGAFDGTMTAEGEGNTLEGDMAWPTTVTAKGQVGPDKQKPSVRFLSHTDAGISGATFPWDRFELRVSEGVDATVFSSSVSQPDPPHLSWSSETREPSTGWAGVLRMTGRLDSFTEEDTVLRLLIEGLADTAGNKTDAEQTIRVLGLGPIQPQFDLDSVTGPHPRSWGEPTASFLGQQSGADPHCEKGGCVMLGPIDVYASPSLGIAGRLNATGAREIAIRFRVLAMEQQGGGQLSLGAILVPVGGVPVTAERQYAGEFRDLGVAAGDLRWGTDWETSTIEIPAGKAEDLGLVIYFGTISGGCRVPMRTGEQALVIDSIVLQ